MNLYQFHNTVVLRHPVYSFQQFGEDNLATILHDGFFQNAIYLCSPTVFGELKKLSFEYAKLNPRLKNTLLKYFNRMCYRPTPFALCAAVGTVNWFESNDVILINTATFKPHVKLSYTKSLQVAAKVLGTAKNPVTIKANATLYKAGNQIRYIKSLNGDTDKIAFYIASAETTVLLNKILKSIVTPRAIKEVETIITQKANCTAAEANEYLQSLLKEQILVDATEVNITGKDYLDALIEQPGTSSFTFDKSIHHHLKEVVDVSSFNNYLRLHSPCLEKNDLYVNLESKLKNSEINATHQKAIIDGLHCLAQLGQPHTPKGISQFMQQFNKKFEGQTIPLLLALDPEVGIGYGELTSGNESLSFADDIAWQKVRINADTVSWGKLQSLVLKKWMAGARHEPVKISANDLSEIKQTQSAKLPSTLSVMFRLAGEKVFIEQVAGVTATSLIGRFTPVNAKIDKLAQDIAWHETDHNPGVIYAEIVHTCHRQTANIDRRNHIYKYEIVMLTPSTLDEQYQISLSDLYVSVQNNEVLMWSAKQHKRVIPRLSSAFNYQRDDLAAFRFLCDLQHVGVQTNFNFAIENFYPGLDFYPRVEFEQAIIQCAQWHLDEETIAPLIDEKDKLKRLTTFIQLRQNLKLCKYIALTQHDHQLVFDLDRAADIDFFLDTIKPLKRAVIREVLAETMNNPVTRNENNQGIASQFIATLYHQGIVYQPKTLNLPVTKKQPVRVFTPGSEWMYFKLYCHQARSNELLGNVFYKTIKQALKDGSVTQWFFTRYNDPDHHLRFRVKVQSGKHQKVMEVFNRVIVPYQKQGLLTKIMIDTYDRELERYPDIDVFENIFYHSSNWVCNYLRDTRQQLTQQDCLSFAFVTTRKLLQSVGFSNDERIDYLTGVVDAFSNEFGHVPDLKYQLDLTYRKHKTILWSLKDQSAVKAQSKLNDLTEKSCSSLSAYFKKIHALPVQVKFKHLSDIVHMHLNRVFNDQPREQEFTLYYMLLKYEKSGKYINQAV